MVTRPAFTVSVPVQSWLVPAACGLAASGAAKERSVNTEATAMARIRLIEDLGELVGSFIASSGTRGALGIDARDAAPEYVTGI